MTTQSLNSPGLHTQANAQEIGEEIYHLIEELYPICRSITGDGFRQTLARLREEIPLSVHEVPTGTEVFDWVVPKEWNIRDAYVKNPRGEKIIDFHKHNLHVVSYSVPITRKMCLEELKKHLHTLPDRPDLIPYRTSYYSRNWGFCLAHSQLVRMENGEYDVCIDSSLQDGKLTLGECYIPGLTKEEILISVHACHPSLCNDNLSGVAVAALLAKRLKQSAPMRYSYRFLFIPGTIGSITWLALNEERAAAIRHGLVLTCVGDRGAFTYKKSRRGDAEIDRAVSHILKHAAQNYEIVDFSPYGYDERQYCSPAFNLPVGCLMRTPHGHFPEYHTSGDNLDFVDAASLGDTFSTCLSIFQLLENNKTYLSRNPKCEPQLGKRGLYGPLGGQDIKTSEMAMLWVLNFSDGTHSLLDIADKSGLQFDILVKAAEALDKHELLQDAP